jgi:hypothetical protein
MRNIFLALFGLSFLALFGAPASARPSKGALCLQGQSAIISLIKERLQEPEVISNEAIERLVRKHNRHCPQLELAELELLAAENLTEKIRIHIEQTKALLSARRKVEPKVEPKTEPKAFRAALNESCDYTMSFSISANNAEIERLKGVARQRHAKGKSPLACVISLNKAMAHQARLIFNLAKR